jgi:glycosyltransferase involved in cell wall biosynthesis
MTSPHADADAGAPPLVSAVIPTRGRPALVRRAVRSVLAQSHPDVEAVVVLDGPDPATERALAPLAGPRLRLVRLPRSRGGGAARNAGVAAAAGRWIALLDDDDEWLPDKVRRQVEAAARSPHRHPILCSRVVARTPRGDHLWPRRPPDAGEPLSEYLFARRSLFQGEGLVQSSMVLAPRVLFRRVPFAEGLPAHQDWDWVLRAAALEGTGVEFVWEPLAVWNVEQPRPGVTGGTSWRDSLAWVDASRERVTPRAYAAFVATSVCASAAREGRWSALLPLLRAAVRGGRPRPIDLLLFAGIWAVPRPLRRWLRGLRAERRRP